MFRVKITLLSLVLSASVLIGFGFFFLSIQKTAGMARIDREILALGGSQLRMPAPLEHWLFFEKTLRLIYGTERPGEVIARITGPLERFFTSPQWPKEISEASFPEFDNHLDGPEVPFDAPFWVKRPVIRTIETGSGAWRVGIMGNSRVTMMVGMSLAYFYREQEQLRFAFLLAVPVALVLLAGGGWLIADRALKPVSEITRTAERINARALDQRISEGASDRELSRLVQVINGMLDRLQKSFEQAVRFSADAAHELQTPLTILQGELDDAVQHAAVGSDEQARYGGLLEEVQRLKAIVQKLLIIARADAGKLNLRMEPVDFSAMVGSAAEDVEVVAPRLAIERDITAGIVVPADRDLLRQVIQNLTSNAVKYNLEGGLIRFHLGHLRDRAVFTIKNTGSPIPAEDRDRIFGRFYRPDISRGSAIPGAGLGLGLARDIASAHGGDLRLDPAADGLVSFTLSLPVVPPTQRKQKTRDTSACADASRGTVRRQELPDVPTAARRTSG